MHKLLPYLPVSPPDKNPNSSPDQITNLIQCCLSFFPSSSHPTTIASHSTYGRILVESNVEGNRRAAGMSVAAAATAQNPARHRLLFRLYHSTATCRNRRLKLVSSSDFLVSRDEHFWCKLHPMPLQRRTLFSDTSWWRIRVFASGEAADLSPKREVPGQLTFDEALSIAEVLCIVPSVVYSFGSVVGLLLPGTPKALQANLGNVFFVWQFVMLVGAVVLGFVIRQRQWQRLCGGNGVGGANLMGRIEKVEEELRSSVTIVRVLSRQLEKLGVRFRVTRKALKEPIAEMATLAQKNSEVTRALAVQEDILEKELGEIQKVLLAMQEQQQKQLELILAIGKAGRLLESKKGPESKQCSKAEIVTGASSLILEKDPKQTELEVGRHKLDNDRT